jgi:hypothetical protein
MREVRGRRWLRCTLAGVGAIVGAFVLTIAIVFVYAFRLAFAVRGAPDQGKIRAFAALVGPAWGPWLRVVLVFALAAWIARSSKSLVVEAATVGVIAGLVGLALEWPPDTRGLAIFAATVGVALFGAFAGKLEWQPGS